MKFELKDIVFLAILVVMAFFLFDGCQAKKSLEEQNQAILNYEDSVSFYKTKSGALVASNTALKINSAKQVAGLEKKIKDLKLRKPKVIIEYRNSVEIDSVEVPIEIPCEDFELPFEIDSNYYDIKGVLTNKALKFNSISIPNEQTIAVANKKEKWYKSSVYSVVVKNSNPYIQSTGLQSYTIKPETKFYEKKWFWAAIGFAGGLYVGNQTK